MQDLSYENKRALLMAALTPPGGDEGRSWIRDIFDDRVIVEEDGSLIEIAYTITDNKVTLGERREVKVSYEALAELKGVEVLRTGTFTSMSGEKVTYTDKDLKEIVKNAEKLKDELKPPLVATHKEGVDASVQVFGSVHGGIFHNLRKVGKKLLADLKGVPKKAAELLAEVEEFRISPEIYKNYEDDKGGFHGQALRRVAWVSIPAIKTMAGMSAANLYEEEPDQPTTWIKLHEPNQSPQKKEEVTMSLEKMQEQIDKLSETVGTLTGDKSDLEKKISDLEAEKTQTMTKLSEAEKAERSRKVKEMVTPLRDAGLAPVAADAMEAFAEQLDSSEVLKFGEKEQTSLDAFGEVLSTVFKKAEDGKLVVQFGEVAPGTEGFSETDDEKTIIDAMASAAPAPGN